MKHPKQELLPISEEEYISQLNIELRKDDFYQEGMEVVAAPEGARGRNITGYTLKGGKNWPLLLATAASKVEKKYRLRTD